MTEKEQFLKDVEAIWNSIKPVSYNANLMTKLDGLEDINRFVQDVSQKEKQITAMLKGFVITRNISQDEQSEITESIKELFNVYLANASK